MKKTHMAALAVATASLIGGGTVLAAQNSYTPASEVKADRECLSNAGRNPIAPECFPTNAPVFVNEDGGLRVDCGAPLVWCDDEGA